MKALIDPEALERKSTNLKLSSRGSRPRRACWKHRSRAMNMQKEVARGPAAEAEGEEGE